MNTQLSTTKRSQLPVYDLPGVSMTLTAAEEKLRAECERTIHDEFAVIEKGMERVVRAAETLRDQLLYRSTHGTWEAYCRDTFKKGARRIQQLVAGQAVIDEFKALPPAERPSVLPSTEKQTRALQPLSKEERREVWDTSVKESDGKEPSAGKVREVAERRKPTAPLPGPLPVGRGEGMWPKPDRYGLYSDEGARVFSFGHGTGNAWIKCLEVKNPNGFGECWATAVGYDSHADWAGEDNSLELKADLFLNLQDAIQGAANDLRDSMAPILRDKEVSAKTKQWAQMVTTWAGTQIKNAKRLTDVSDPARETELPFKPSVPVGRLDDLTLAKLNGDMQRRVTELAKEIAIKVGGCVRAIGDLPLPLRHEFDQTNYLLGCAGTELARMVEAGKRFERREPAKASVPKAGFVIVRLPNEPKGRDVRGKPRFGPGWGFDLGKAKLYASKQEALEHAQEWDKIVSFGEAVKLAEKAKGSR